MDRSRKKQGFGTGTTFTQKVEAEIKGLDIDREMDVIGAGSYFKGNFRFGPYTRIEGKLEGSIDSSGILVISSTSEIKADVSGKTIIIDGKVSGNISSDTAILIQEHGTISGNIKSPYIEIAPGASINGNISMGRYHQRFIDLESIAQGS